VHIAGGNEAGFVDFLGLGFGSQTNGECMVISNAHYVAKNLKRQGKIPIRYELCAGGLTIDFSSSNLLLQEQGRRYGW
jgi:hypothetical protein